MGEPPGGRLRELRFPKKRRFLVDNDLSPLIVTALREFEFLSIQSVREAYGDGDIDDETIIRGLSQTNSIWITHDKAAKRKHAPSLKQYRVTVLWIMGRDLIHFDHVQIVFKVLEQLINKANQAHGAIHFRAGRKTGLTVEWAEDSRDRPRQHKGER